MSKPAKRTAPAAGRPSAADALLRRADLFNAAMRVFQHHGFHGASLDVIARKAGISRTTIYRQFGSKENLFYETALQSVSDLRRKLNAVPAEGRLPSAVLFDFVLLFATAVKNRHSVALLRLAIAEQTSFPALAREIRRHVDDTAKPLTTYLGQLVADNIVSLDDPALAARQLMANAAGGFEFLLGERKEKPADLMARAAGIVRIFLHGAGCRPA